MSRATAIWGDVVMSAKDQVAQQLCLCSPCDPVKASIWKLTSFETRRVVDEIQPLLCVYDKRLGVLECRTKRVAC